jgi:NAD(P)-dependent dehydrogenase (short-subunit alcohol dehydrogenase family)
MGSHCRVANVAAPPHPVLGKTVMVTGAARGIGAELAQRLAARGAKVVAVGLEPERLEATARLCSPDALAVEADVTDLDALQGAVAAAVERFGGLDVLVANAGIAGVGTLRTVDPAAFDRTVEVNLLGQFRTVRAALDELLARRGYLLAVASAASIAAPPAMAAYAASKAGVEAMCNALRLEVAHLGVGVGVAYPWWIDTDLVRTADELEAFRTLRESMPGPMSEVTALGDLGKALADAVERRARTVALPRWVGAARYARGLLNSSSGDAMFRTAAPAIVQAAEDEVRRRGAGAASMLGLPGDTVSERVAPAGSSTPERG